VLLESIASKDKSSLQVYEETCKRLKICPCSMIIRSLYTTHINLQNYGLGPKGSAALAVALIVNFQKNIFATYYSNFFYSVIHLLYHLIYQEIILEITACRMYIKFLRKIHILKNM
jgi:uncharacterized membrane protein